MSEYRTKDSGEREEYKSGMRRDTQEGKPDYTLLPREFLTRWAELMVRGAEKYGRDNWRKADSEAELERFKASAFRHLVQWLDGDLEEDHATAVAFNLAAAEYVKDRLKTRDQSAPFTFRTYAPVDMSPADWAEYMGKYEERSSRGFGGGRFG